MKYDIKQLKKRLDLKGLEREVKKHLGVSVSLDCKVEEGEGLWPYSVQVTSSNLKNKVGVLCGLMKEAHIRSNASAIGEVDNKIIGSFELCFMWEDIFGNKKSQLVMKALYNFDDKIWKIR